MNNCKDRSNYLNLPGKNKARFLLISSEFRYSVEKNLACSKNIKYISPNKVRKYNQCINGPYRKKTKRERRDKTEYS